MAHYEYKINVTEETRREMAIAMLSELGITGFEENEEGLIAISTQKIPEQDLDPIFQTLSLTYSESVIEDQNWNAIWEASYEPITVTFPDSKEVFAHVRAHFHEPYPQAKFDLIITPKMSFGTGHHATTYGMISYMSRLDLTSKSVVDFGTGTGVLAILAEKMGAKNVLATDNDPGCITNATENLTVNACSRVQLACSNRFETLQQPDLILANINLNIIKENLRLIKSACHTNTILLFSGILVTDESDILSALHEASIHEIDMVKNNGWLIIAAKRADKL